MKLKSLKLLLKQTESESLRPQVAEQEKLEAELKSATERVGQLRAREAEIKRLDEKITDLRAKFARNKAQIDAAEAELKKAAELEKLTARESEIVRELTALRARLEHDEQFQAEVRNGLCPILSQKCLNLKPGETLESFLANKFTGVRTTISGLETEQRELTAALTVARQAERAAASLSTLRERQEEIKAEGLAQKAERETLEAALAEAPQLAEKIAAVENSLAALGNPKARIQLLQSEAAAIGKRREELTALAVSITQKQAERDSLREKLAAFGQLDDDWQRLVAERDATAAAHREYVANESLAQLAPAREEAFAAAVTALTDAETKLATARQYQTEAETAYNGELHAREKFALAELERQLAEQRANLGNAERLRTQTELELNRLAAVRKSMLAEFKEQERLEEVLQTTEFIRETLKKSAPLVAKNYIHYVSLEANQMFRDISGNAEQTLKWTEDYGIMLEQRGFDRPFVSMSGGEQMAAALSVRLALLKQLSDIRIAFFDEPTTNMDEARRERLAEQISLITQRQTFDQLFVISHDDTFENYVDHVLSVEQTETGELSDVSE